MDVRSPWESTIPAFESIYQVLCLWSVWPRCKVLCKKDLVSGPRVQLLHPLLELVVDACSFFLHCTILNGTVIKICNLGFMCVVWQDLVN